MTSPSGSNGSEARWLGLAALPDFGSRVLSASAVVAYVAVGAAAILGRSVTKAPRDALAWVLPRDGSERRIPRPDTRLLSRPALALPNRDEGYDDSRGRPKGRIAPGYCAARLTTGLSLSLGVTVSTPRIWFL